MTKLVNRVTAAALLLATLAGGRATAESSPTVASPSGRLSGVSADGVTAFKGIRFAEPPVGPLRWRAPQPLPTWPGVRAADRTGPACPQHVPKAWGADPKQSEDCLYLNIWRPASTNNASRLPVMVWIYGGAFAVGDSASRIYDGAQLARDGVVVVSFNYRLGRLGWFALPALTHEGGGAGTADFGLMDQIAALKWVRTNIAAFGGDPANVTLFGESAGGMSVNLLMASPAARGLFAKAITESGLGRAEAKPLAVAETQGAEFARSVGALDLETLRRLPVETVLGGGVFDVSSDRNPGPIVDGRLVPEQVDRAFAQGHEAPVPWLVGTNDYEASLFPGLLADPKGKVLSQIPAAGRPLVTQAFDPGHRGDERMIAAGIVTDSVFTEPARFLASRQTKLGEPVYRYLFAYSPEATRTTSPGAGHGAEIEFVFDTLGTFHGAAGGYTAADRRISVEMGRYWTNFAKTGDPNGAGLPTWPKDDDETLVIDASGPHAVKSLRKLRLDLAASRVDPALR